MKRVRQDDKINEQNRKQRSALRTAFKKAKTSKKPEDLNVANRLADSAAAKNLISDNKAARDKSRLLKAIKATS
ncbi:unnamed protein product [Didymodactylos carnosus]|uniref:30S ribosomal protein S20 n=1 Tax=Didymodactylos carnosus TaxID=1234261 RepID=A0A8S2CYU7_9BILA|nr:unnamed protein product [Didymodactylos carnosus]CAF3623150.1 unnamed protein product [Didymodactylos carnosus]